MENLMISYYLPNEILENKELSNIYKDWTEEKIFQKTGIKERHIAAVDEFVSDMSINSCNNLFKEFNINKNDVEFIILITQSPDYLLPTTACIVQDKVGIPTTSGAIDINLGCSGYIYGLSVAKALVISNTVNNVLLITSETYSKHIHPMDKSVRTIFGDGSSATFITKDNVNSIGNFAFGTDGSGCNNLIVPVSGMKLKKDENTKREIKDESNNIRTEENLYMDGTEIFTFTLKVVPKIIKEALLKNNLKMVDIDLFVFHQANKYMLDYLKKILKIQDEKFYVNIENVGNTVSSTIPIALKMAEQEGKLTKRNKIMLVGFGVGLSWGATILEW